MQNMIQTLSLIKNLAAVDSLRQAASAGYAPPSRPKVNSHIHLPPNFSAFNSIPQAVDCCVKESVRVVGVTNYYDYHAYGQFALSACEKGIFPLFGLEVICLIESLVQSKTRINDPGNPGKMYLCGKGAVKIADLSSRAALLLQTVRSNDDFRMKRMIDCLRLLFNKHGLAATVYDDDIKRNIARRCGCAIETVYLQERHLCQAFQEFLFDQVPSADRAELLTKILGVPSKSSDNPVAVQNDIRNHLLKSGKPAFIEETFLDFDQAKTLILEMSAIPCYPVLADGANPLCGFEESPETLIRNIQSKGIRLAEFIPIRNTPELLCNYVRALRAAGIPVLAGTEHNTLDLIPIEPTCLGGQSIPEDLKDIFYEGACVVAAHQFLVLHGQCGFVDARGIPNPAYSDDESRIAAFRTLGAAVLEKYFNLHKAQ